jgi:hypothetical protein
VTAALASASLSVVAVAATAAIAIFFVLGWRWILRDTERDAIARVIAGYTGRARLISS